MYHYVREIKQSRYPNIKGLEAHLFKKQLDYIEQNYSVVTAEQVIAYYNGAGTLPENAALLTFDDGYSDHFQYVYPILKNRKMQGSFFVPVKPVQENRVLDVNKIHLLLEAVPPKKLIAGIKRLLPDYQKEHDVADFEAYYHELAKPGRYDTAEVIFIKRLLQHKLPDDVRLDLLSRLFETFISVPEHVIARELYMTGDQCKCLVEDGMHVGAHTCDHLWLNQISDDRQDEQFRNNVSFLESIGADADTYTMAYPYGAYNSKTLDLMNKYNMKLGFTTEPIGNINLKETHPYELPRLDTNDLPVQQHPESSVSARN